MALPARYPDRHAALAALEAEFENLVEAVRAADRHMFYELTSQLCEAMWSVLFRRGHTDEWIAVHRLGVDAAGKSGDLTMEARMHVQLAFGLMAQDRLAEAEQEFTLGLAAARAAGHDQGRATALESLGLLLLGRESFDRAADLFAEARTVAERVGDPRALALLEHHCGRALAGLGRFEEASLQFDRALAAFRALTIRDNYNEGRILMSRAEASLRAGRPEQAGEVLADAARIMTAEDSLVMQAQVAVLRAWYARESADLLAERLFLVQAQELHQRAGSRLTPRVSERITFLDAARTRLG
jgi:tetratricopeptide (TPR) repeat protein